VTHRPAAGDLIAHNLQDAIDRLREDCARVELWAQALGCFARPTPEYDPALSYLEMFHLPSEPGPDDPEPGHDSAQDAPSGRPRRGGPAA
jgi:hypothetical protein